MKITYHEIAVVVLSVQFFGPRQVRITANKSKIKDFPKLPIRFYLQGAIRHCQKYTGYSFTLIYLNVIRRKISGEFQLKGGIWK